MIRPGAHGLSWERGHDTGTTAVRGRAVDLLLALPHRRPAADVDVQVLGVAEVRTNWLDRTPG
jgi:hypothetical protein